MRGAFERKENNFQELKNLIYSHDTAIRNNQIYHRILKIKISMIYF